MRLEGRIRKIEERVGMSEESTTPEWALRQCRLINEFFGDSYPELQDTEDRVEEKARELARKFPSERAFRNTKTKLSPKLQAMVDEICS